MQIYMLLFVCGNVSLLLFTHSVPGLWWLLLLVAGVFFVLLGRRQPKVLILLSFLFGLSWSLWHLEQRLNERLPAEYEGVWLQVSGRVVDIPHVRERYTRIIFAADCIAILAANESCLFEGGEPHFLQLNWYGKPLVGGGDVWKLKAKLKRPHSFLNDGGFDYERWLFQKSIIGTGYIKADDGAVKLGHQAWTMASWRDLIQRRLNGAVDKDSDAGRWLPIISALTLGNRHGLSAEHWRVLRATGTNHLMAISGLHVGLVSGLVLFLLPILFRILLWRCTWSWRFPMVKVAAIVALIFAATYSFLAGFTVPTQRALLMIAVVIFFWLFNRKSNPFSAVVTALFVVLLWAPLSVYSVGFWLSFSAVIILLLGLLGQYSETNYRVRPWWQALRAQGVIFVGLMPLTLLLFSQVSLLAPLANVVAIPVVAWLLVPLMLMAILLLFVFPAISEWLLGVVAWILEYLWIFLVFLADSENVLMSIPSKVFLLSAFVLIAVVFLLPRGVVPRFWIGFLLLPVFLWRAEPIPVGSVRVTVLDVGQGLSVVVETATHTLLYDAGVALSERFNMGSSVVLPFLKYHGVSEIDQFILSHDDNDHVGGAEAVVSVIPANEMLAGDVLFDGRKLLSCQSGQVWEWDKVTFEVLWPVIDTVVDRAWLNTQGDNNHSCVVKVSVNGYSVLLPGDIEEEVELRLLDTLTGGELNSDVLVAPHHGSATSSTAAFVRAVNPKYVVYSSGYRNRFYHPHTLVRGRYSQLGVKALNTAISGQVSFMLEGDRGVSMSEYRKEHPKVWYFLP